MQAPPTRFWEVLRQLGPGMILTGSIVGSGELIATPTVRKHLPGVLTLLHDAGYNDEEALRWLYTADDSLPGIPANALSGARATEVKRRAQALGF